MPLHDCTGQAEKGCEVRTDTIIKVIGSEYSPFYGKPIFLMMACENAKLTLSKRCLAEEDFKPYLQGVSYGKAKLQKERSTTPITTR